MSDRAENLEAIEQRLKNDILAESQKCVSLLCHGIHAHSQPKGTAVWS